MVLSRLGFETTTCKGVGKGAECQHSVLSGFAGNEASLLARNEPRHRTRVPGRRLSERSEAESRRAHQRKAPPFTGNVIQIRMTEKRTGTENVPVSFFIKKNAQKG